MQSQYTIIAESTNPFIDGSTHNVTMVLLHPHFKQQIDTQPPKNPSLAMMRIEPGVAMVGLDIYRNSFGADLDTRAYGWIYLKVC
jgi:hypothetical protein